MTIQDILTEFRLNAHSEKEKGTAFEKLICKFLTIDPTYASLFDEVWEWTDFPYRAGVPDIGIDLVAKERITGHYWAIQCKFYEPTHQVSKDDIDTFLSASGMGFYVDGIEKFFSQRLVVSTTDRWNSHAEASIKHQQIPVSRLSLSDLANSPIDWSGFSLLNPDKLKLVKKKTLRDHQKAALADVVKGFETYPRGQLIMACGTGKTFTSLKIAETITEKKGTVLFLVPSIALLSQTLREWSAQADCRLKALAVCSDAKVSKSNEDLAICDLAFPATTSAAMLKEYYSQYRNEPGMTVIFSTYQSIEAVAAAQQESFGEFDLIICDEAHRTTGKSLVDGEDDSAFIRVHQNDFIRSKRRLYMTATPRIYDEPSKKKADDNAITLCSMDDEATYGPVFHHLGFSSAVSLDLLSDYKVIVMAVDELSVNNYFSFSHIENGGDLDLIPKIVGCWNALSKRMASKEDEELLAGDLVHMRRAVAFTHTIAESKMLKQAFTQFSEKNPDPALVNISIDHVDGSMNALQRGKLLDWLKDEPEANECRILTNARCLSEGVDVPALDAVMFMDSRSSMIDVVQSVGRVMRKAGKEKKYGYVIIPIVCPADVAPDEALKDNKRYKVVWDVLQALRAHDDRFNLPKSKITIFKVVAEQKDTSKSKEGYGPADENQSSSDDGQPEQMWFDFPNFEEWKDKLLAKLVLKCGEKEYWESWAKEVKVVAENQIARLKQLLKDKDSEYRKAFDTFLSGLRANLNDSITQDEAVEMLSQHLVTKPVFDALFDNYSFVHSNPVSVSMQNILELLDKDASKTDNDILLKFYKSVKEKAKGNDSSELKQSIILELYNKFFKLTFPSQVEKLGIVYTPVEVVDFIIHSVEDVLKKEFKSSLSDKNVHILDPFTGTGTFIVRLLQSGLIKSKDLLRKYQNELHANEIVLLAYYIAAINIESVFHDLNPAKEYQPFEGIVLTDTFQLGEDQSVHVQRDGTVKYMSQEKVHDTVFPENSSRAKKQKEQDIQVIIGNPPYSIGQESANDDNQNQHYEHLDQRISLTYAARSNATLSKALYDSYIKAFRWASDRIKDKGIVAYVSNGGYIDSNGMDGFRKTLANEFNSIYCFNLRGNQRTSGETSRREGGKIFGSGSRAQIAITLLVKNPASSEHGAIHYHDIGDYLATEEKLKILADFKSINGISWDTITPNEAGDWLNQRSSEFGSYIPLAPEKKFDEKSKSVFSVIAIGVATNRDAWSYNFSEGNLAANMQAMIDFYNQQRIAYQDEKQQSPASKFDEFCSNDTKKISWTRGLKADAVKNKFIVFDKRFFRSSIYRPFIKQYLYYDNPLVESPGQWAKLFPTSQHKNLVICVSGVGAGKVFSTLITDQIPCLDFLEKTQCFPLYWYEEINKEDGVLPGMEQDGQFIQHDGISDFILKRFRSEYRVKVEKEDIFYFVYGLLHSPEYRTKFAADLKKMLPRLPMVSKSAYLQFRDAGRRLAALHLNYETVEPWPLDEIAADMDSIDYRVEQMRWAKDGKQVRKDMICYNSTLTLAGIPEKAYKYIVNGKSALEWLMERYAVTTDPKSGIVKDPNLWCEEHNDPQYIVNLIKRMVRVSVETVDIVNSLPKLEEQKTNENNQNS